MRTTQTRAKNNRPATSPFFIDTPVLLAIAVIHSIMYSNEAEGATQSLSKTLSQIKESGSLKSEYGVLKGGRFHSSNTETYRVPVDQAVAQQVLTDIVAGETEQSNYYTRIKLAALFLLGVLTWQFASDGSDNVTGLTLTPPQLFTEGNNIVDFNLLTENQQAAVLVGAQLTNGLGGNDNVILPTGAGGLNGQFMFNAGSGHDSVDGFSVTVGFQINGEDGNDDIFGTQGADTINGDSDNDTMNGYLGNDLLLGSHGNDELIGAENNDTLNGGDGNDILLGDMPFGSQSSANIGNDSLTGGNGVDTFVFVFYDPVAPGLRLLPGNDTITDLGAGADVDVLEFQNLEVLVLGAPTLADLDLVIDVSQIGSDTLIKDTSTLNSILLKNVTLSSYDVAGLANSTDFDLRLVASDGLSSVF